MFSRSEIGFVREIVKQQGQVLSMIADGQPVNRVLASILQLADEDMEIRGAWIFASGQGDENFTLIAEYPKKAYPCDESLVISTALSRSRQHIENPAKPGEWFHGFPVTDGEGSLVGVLVIVAEVNKLCDPSEIRCELILQLVSLALKTALSKGANQRASDREVETRRQISKERLDLYNLMMDAPAMIAVLKEPEHTFELANHKYLKAVSGDNPRNIIGKPIKEALPELVGQGIIDILDEVYRSGEPYHGNQQMIQLDRYGEGELEGAYFNFTYHPIRDISGEVEGIFVHAVDVTELVRARQKVEENERLLLGIIDSSTNPIAVYKGREMRIVLTNQALLDTWNKTSPVIGQTFHEALPELEGQGFYDLLDKVYTTGQTYRAHEDRVDLMYHGSLRTYYFDFTYKAMYDEHGRIFGVLNTATDVTELVESRHRLQDMQDQLQLSMAAGRLGTWNYIIDTGDIQWDARTKELFGFPTNADTTTLDDIINYVVEEDRPRVLHGIKMALSPETGSNYDVQYRTQGPDGIQRWIQAQGKAYFNEYNMPIRFSGIAFDITAQKMLERQKDNFLGIASHELKTPVTSLKAYAQVLEATFRREGNERAAGMLGRMDQQLNKLTSLIGDLLDVTKFQSGKLQYNDTRFDFTLLGEEVVEELQRLTSKHQITRQFHGPAYVFADRERIGQVISNLLNNAIKYSPDADKIHIESTIENGHLKVCVQDYGVGIDEENKDRVFEQFYRVSGDIEHTFPGMGLGLYICSEIVKREGGRIWVENSKPGEGATFCFTLPLAETNKQETNV